MAKSIEQLSVMKGQNEGSRYFQNTLSGHFIEPVLNIEGMARSDSSRNCKKNCNNFTCMALPFKILHVNALLNRLFHSTFYAPALFILIQHKMYRYL